MKRRNDYYCWIGHHYTEWWWGRWLTVTQTGSERGQLDAVWWWKRWQWREVAFVVLDLFFVFFPIRSWFKQKQEHSFAEWAKKRYNRRILKNVICRSNRHIKEKKRNCTQIKNCKKDNNFSPMILFSHRLQRSLLVVLCRNGGSSIRNH